MTSLVLRVAAAALAVVLAAPLRASAEGPLECPPAADDDARRNKARAAEHYRRGQELYAQGEYERAIPEFRAAYCYVPAPEAVYNVAQAYERLVDYQRAVAWFEAYLAVLPRGLREEKTAVENRLRVLRRLPARIRVSTDPPGASIRLEGAGGQSVEGKANAEPLRVAAGTWNLRLELAGHVPIVETIVAEIGQPYTYSYRLTPETGILRVSARPRETRILVDDRVVGTGRFIDRVPVGERVVTLEAPLRPTEKRTVRVNATGVAELHVDMQPARPKNGKVELLILSTAFGVLEGGLVASSLTDNPAIVGGAAVATGALGFLVPLVFLPRQVPTGQTSLMIGGRGWGAIEGLGIATIVYGNPAAEENRVASAFFVSGGSVVAGVGLGLVARHLDVSAGDAALVNSGGIWGTTAAALLLASVDAGEEIIGPVLLTGVNVGLLGGAVLAARLEPSRGRMFLIDVAGVAGIVTGTALAALVQQGDKTAQFALGGLGGGLLVGALLTTSVDSDDDDAGMFAGISERGTPIVGLSGTW
jgi:hypothetical protein